MKFSLIGHNRLYDIQCVANSFFDTLSDADYPIVESRVVINTPADFAVETVISDLSKTEKSYFSGKEIETDRERYTIKKSFYDAAVKFTGISPPWGIFTGIRPFKYFENSLKTNNRNLLGYFGIEEKKSNLLFKILKYRNSYTEKYSENNYSLYISIPFCPSRCTYCSFVSQATGKLFEILDVYLEKMKEELRTISEIANIHDLNLKSVYIGGGTPGVLTPAQINNLLSFISENFNLSSVLDFTYEVGRPDTVSEEKLRIIKNYNVNRVCINPQTLNDNVLVEIGRKHTVSDYYNAMNIAKRIGFETINSDIIVGLPKDYEESLKNTVNDLISLGPDNITTHILCIKKSSTIRGEGYSDYLKNLNCIDLMNWAETCLIEAGYNPYYMYKQKSSVGSLENTGFTTNGHHSYYNIVMMDEYESVIGVGAGSGTKLIANGSSVKLYNPKYPFEYISLNQRKNQNINKVLNFFNKIVKE